MYLFMNIEYNKNFYFFSKKDLKCLADLKYKKQLWTNKNINAILNFLNKNLGPVKKEVNSIAFFMH